MTDTKRSGFKTVEADYEEQSEKLAEYRREVRVRIFKILSILLVLAIAVEIVYALRSFDSYDVRDSLERGSSSAMQYAAFHDCLIEYSNDGVSCLNENDEVLWNQSFEMISPKIEMCKDYLMLYDVGGTEIFVLTESGLQKNIETSSPIQQACIAGQGTTAVLMKDGDQSQVKLFDIKGTELANGVFYEKKGGFPVDIALSYDATKLAIDMVDVSGGRLNTTISFYNFGSVGQSEIDNIVATYTFEDLFVPQIDYVSSSKMIGMGTGRMLVFDGSQKPELSQAIVIEEEVLSYFHNENYVGIVYDAVEEERYRHVKVMDFRGRTAMENDISIVYDEIEFLANGEICVRSKKECEIFTMHSIKKFSYTFDKDLYKILSGKSGSDYTFIFKDTIDEVRLK